MRTVEIPLAAAVLLGMGFLAATTAWIQAALEAADTWRMMLRGWQDMTDQSLAAARFWMRRALRRRR